MHTCIHTKRDRERKRERLECHWLCKHQSWLPVKQDCVSKSFSNNSNNWGPSIEICKSLGPFLLSISNQQLESPFLTLCPVAFVFLMITELLSQPGVTFSGKHFLSTGHLGSSQVFLLHLSPDIFHGASFMSFYSILSWRVKWSCSPPVLLLPSQSRCSHALSKSFVSICYRECYKFQHPEP